MNNFNQNMTAEEAQKNYRNTNFYNPNQLFVTSMGLIQANLYISEGLLQNQPLIYNQCVYSTGRGLTENNPLKNYCVCDLIPSREVAPLIHLNQAPSYPIGSIEELAPVEIGSFSEAKNTSGKKSPSGRKRNKKIFTDSFIKQAKEILPTLLNMPDQDKAIFKRSSKVSVPEGQTLVKERATYIGVSSNGKNWQSLIVIDNTKVYLGTYKTQREAAVMFDFHSIMVKYLKARVNNEYRVKDVIRMIENFLSNDNDFKASEYLNKY